MNAQMTMPDVDGEKVAAIFGCTGDGHDKYVLPRSSDLVVGCIDCKTSVTMSPQEATEKIGAQWPN